MNKMLRKYQRPILAVAMALLLIVWLGGSALQAMIAPSREGMVVAKSKLGDIIERDRRRATFETELLDRLRVRWQYPWPMSQMILYKPLNVLDWILITREAEHYGMMPRSVEIEALLPAFGLNLERVRRLATQQDIKVEIIYSALGRFISVFNTVGLMVGGTTVSEAAVLAEARDQLEKAKVELVSVKGLSFVDPSEEFSDLEMRTHLEKYKGKKPGPKGGINFGYFQPVKVKAQYIKIDVDKVAKHVRVRPKTLEKRAREYWRENRESPQFRRPEEKQGDGSDSDGDAAGDESAEDEAVGADKGPKSFFFETFEAARDIAVQAVRRQAADEEVRKVAGWLLERLVSDWDGLTEGEDGFKVGTPELLEPGYYDKVLAELPVGLRYPGAVTVGETDFFSQADAARVSEVGASRAVIGSSKDPFSRFAFRYQGVSPMPDEKSKERNLMSSKGQTAPVVFGNRDGDLFLFRVVEVREPQPPESLDEVREQVVEDLRLLRGYERAKAAAERLMSSISFDGLQGAWNAEGNDLKKGDYKPPVAYYTPAPFPRKLRPIQTASFTYVNPVFISGIGAVSSDQIEKIFDLQSREPDRRFDLFEFPDKGLVAVIEWEELEPLREDGYAAQRGRILTQLKEAAVGRAISEWLEPDRLHDRLDFELVGSGS